VAIGEQRRPEPCGRPGYLRVDTAHQWELDGVKGVYYINAVDEVTIGQATLTPTRTTWVFPTGAGQVEHNRESTARQNALADRACQLTIRHELAIF
jgi:hypothetical protein